MLAICAKQTNMFFNCGSQSVDCAQTDTRCCFVHVTERIQRKEQVQKHKQRHVYNAQCDTNAAINENQLKYLGFFSVKYF